MSEKQITKKDESIFEMIEAVKEKTIEILPKHLEASRFMANFFNQFRINPKLLLCSKASVLNAFNQCVTLGLEVGPLAHAYLIPYKNECQLSVSYKGMIDLAMRSGKIKEVSARIVNEGDVFEFEHGTKEYIRHIPKLIKRGNFIAVYAVARFLDDSIRFEIMTAEEVDMNRSKSMSKDSGPSFDFFDEMAKKSVIRRLFKYLQISIDLQEAINIDEQTDVKQTIRIEPEKTETQKQFEALIESKKEDTPQIEEKKNPQDEFGKI